MAVGGNSAKNTMLGNNIAMLITVPTNEIPTCFDAYLSTVSDVYSQSNES